MKNRPSGTQTHEATHQALRPRQQRFALPYRTLGAAFLAYSRLPHSTDCPALPTRRHDQSTARPRAGHRSPTKPTLCRASIDADQPTNASHLGPGSLPATPRPAARRRPTPRPSSPRSPPRKRWRNPPSCSRSQARVRADGRKVPMGALGGPLSVPHRYGQEPSSWTPKSQRERRSRPAAQPLRRSGGVAGPRATGRQSASRRTAKQQSQRAPLHRRPGMGQAAKGQSAQGREMAAYLLCSLRSAAEEQPKPVPGLEARVGGAESNHAARATHRDRCTAVGLPEDGSPDALSARQAYGKPPYHGPVAGRQAVAHGARRERAPLARSAAQPPATLPAGSPPPHPPTQLPLCARRARAVTPPPTWPG